MLKSKRIVSKKNGISAKEALEKAENEATKKL